MCSAKGAYIGRILPEGRLILLHNIPRPPDTPQVAAHHGQHLMVGRKSQGSGLFIPCPQDDRLLRYVDECCGSATSFSAPAGDLPYRAQVVLTQVSLHLCTSLPDRAVWNPEPHGVLTVGVPAECCVACMPSCTGAEQAAWSCSGSGVGPADGAAGCPHGAAYCRGHSRHALLASRPSLHLLSDCSAW